MIRIVLADDHQVVRQGLRALLESEPDIRIVGEAESGLEVAEVVELHKPDVLLLDLMMPGLNGVDVTQNVARAYPGTAIVILSMHNNEAYVLECLRNGALGYVLKGSGMRDVVDAIRTTHAGQRYLCPQLSARAIEAYIEKFEHSSADGYDTLTRREREVLQMTAEGLTNTDIADHLNISPRTVEVHRANFMHKLDLKNQTEIIRFALRRGMIDVEQP